MTPKSKLDALGDVLGVTDDTRDIERPQAGRGLASVLGKKMVVDDEPETSNREANEKAETAPRSIASREPLSPADAAPTPVTMTTSVVASTSGVSKKTSATVPVGLVRRLREAKQKRWDLPRLVGDYLAAPSAEKVSMVQAENFLESSEEEPRAVESFRLPIEDLDALDSIGASWRMNRSQVLSTVLDYQLAVLGF